MTENNLRDIIPIPFIDDSDTSSSSSDSDGSLEEIFSLISRSSTARRQYTRKYYEDLNDNEFEKRFRLPKETINFLLYKIGHKLESPSLLNHPVSPYLQILITLRYYATGTFQTVLGDLFGVSQATVCRCIERVSEAIAGLSFEEVKLPVTQEEMSAVNLKFFQIANIPSVFGVIDGTHIPIQSPGGENAEIFRNRKGFFSINTQIVVDASLKINDIVARWPGSNHDQSIFNFSQLKTRCENGEFRDGVLLGDSGYSCKSYLITPLANPNTPSERRFQAAFVKTRLSVERTIGVWKKRFPVIATKMHCDVKLAVIVIVATSVLHNWLRERPVPPVENDIPFVHPEVEKIASSGAPDFQRRNEIITNYF